MPGMTRGRRRIANRPRVLAAQKREADALALWLGGATLWQIAGQLLYADASGAKRAVDRGRQKLLLEPIEQAKKDDLERCRRLMMAHFPKALQGDVDHTDRILAIMARRAKLLRLDTGDEEPTKPLASQVLTQVNVLIQVGNETYSLEEWRRKAIEGQAGGQNDRPQTS